MSQFVMDDLFETDDIAEQIELGKKVFALKSSRYTEPLVKSIRDTIRHIRPDADEAEQESLFYRSIYDYWVYGSNIGENFYFGFFDKTGAEKKKYITIMEHVLYCKHLNKQEDAHLLMNKYETYQLFPDDFKRDVILIGSEADYALFCDFVKKHDRFVVKPTDSCLSQGVYLETVTDSSEEGIRSLFLKLIGRGAQNQETLRGSVERSVVLEELIEQGEEMAVLHPQSINCVRMTTVRVDGKVHICWPSVKMGIHGNFLTAAFLGCPTSCINLETGRLETPATTEDCQVYTKHPDSGVEIIGFQVPAWEELKALAVRLSLSLPTLAFTGWDFVWTKNRGWCIMEGNEKGEFGWQRNYMRGMKQEFEELLHWKPRDEFWWKQINQVEWYGNE